MGHLGAEDLPVVLKSFKKEDRFPGPGPSHDEEEGISGRTEHGTGMKTVDLMMPFQSDQEVFEEEPQVSKEGIAIIGALLLVAGEIPGGEKNLFRHFDLGFNLGVIQGDEIGIEIFAIGDGVDGVNIGQQGFHHLPFKVSRFRDELFVIRDDAHSGLSNFYGSLIHQNKTPPIPHEEAMFSFPFNIFQGRLSHLPNVFPHQRILPTHGLSAPWPE